MTRNDVKELRAKIIQGIELSYSRLLTAKQKGNEDLVISHKGKIVRVKARDLKK
jgi:hypothetical protein